MTYQAVFSPVGLGWFWLVLQRVLHRNRIRRGGECSIAPLHAAVPCRRLKRAVSWPALLQGSRGALANTQQRQASVAILWDVLQRELMVCQAQSWETGAPAARDGQLGSHHLSCWAAPATVSDTMTSSASPEVLGVEAMPCSCLRVHSRNAWFGAWNEEKRSKDHHKHHSRALLLLAPALSVVQNHCLCFTWSCSRLPSVPEEHILLYTSIFPTCFRHLCGSVLILPLQKTEIFISPSIFEELRFLSPWIIWLVLCYAAFAASLLYNHCCSQYSVIQPHSSL